MVTPRRSRSWGYQGTRWTSMLSALAGVAMVVGLGALPTPSVASPAAVDPSAPCVNPGDGTVSSPLSTGWGHVGVFNDTSQLFPAQRGPAYAANHGGDEAAVCMARNSFGAFQIAVTAVGAGATINGVSAGNLAGPGGAVLTSDNLRFYREGLVSLVKLSDASYRTDLLPRNADGTCSGDCRMFDALIPTVDPETGGSRTAYPESVPAGETRAVWVDVLAPADQVPGTYAGSIVLVVNGTPISVPLSVRVLTQTIPSHGSPEAAAQGTDLTSEFRVDASGGMNWTKFAQYARLGLENRISLWRDGSPGASAAEWGSISDLLDGTDASIRLPGSRLSSVAVHKWTSAADLATWKTRLAEIGQSDKAWFWCDEVPASTCQSDLTAARSTWAGLPLVAIPRILGAGDPLTRPGGAAGDLSGITGIRGLAPLSTYLHPQAGKEGLNPYEPKTTADRSPAFVQWRDAQPGREFWTYISCMSEGCTHDYTPGNAYAGWPSYAIDHAGSTQSALGWQAFRYGFTAEHYWSVNICGSKAAGADLNSCLYANPVDGGSNGDGNLFYRSTQFGLTGSEIPLETIRLKRIRDGRQAYALLNLRQASHGDAASFLAAAHAEMGSSAISAQAYDQARQALLLANDAPGQMTPPRNVVAAAGNGEATITWDPPLSMPGTFMNYVIFANGVEVGSTMGATTLTVQDLVNGTPYTFTVYAETTAGISPGGTSNRVTPSAALTDLGVEVSVVDRPGETGFTYQVSLDRVGSQDPSDVFVRVVLPPSVGLRAYPSDVCSGDPLVCAVGPVTSENQTVLDFEVMPLSPGPHNASAEVAGGDAEPGNDSDSAEAGVGFVCDNTPSAGKDTIRGTVQPDVLCGLEGNDTLTGGGGDDLLFGGPGADTLSYASAPAAMVVNLNFQDLSAETAWEAADGLGDGADLATGFEHARGSNFDDTLVGHLTASDTVWGLGGNDLLYGYQGNDKHYGGDAKDTLYGHRGLDLLVGGAGLDRLDGGPQHDTCRERSDKRISCEA